MLHSCRVGGSFSNDLAAKAVDEIMMIGGYRAESIAEYCSTSGPPLLDECRVARAIVARAAPMIANYHCHQSCSPRLREII